MKLGRQWDERLKIWDEAFGKLVFTELGNLKMDGFTTYDQLTLEKAASRDFRPFPPGTLWGRKNSFCFSVVLG